MAASPLMGHYVACIPQAHNLQPQPDSQVHISGQLFCIFVTINLHYKISQQNMTKMSTIILWGEQKGVLNTYYVYSDVLSWHITQYSTVLTSCLALYYYLAAFTLSFLIQHRKSGCGGGVREGSTYTCTSADIPCSVRASLTQCFVYFQSIYEFLSLQGVTSVNAINV